MTLKGACKPNDFKLEKYVSSLQGPAKRAKRLLLDKLKKSVKSFQDQAEKSVSDDKRGVFKKKAERVSKDLDVLKVLNEDEIVRYALPILHKIMSMASNPRVPRVERMKARVAAHKPLSTRLDQLKRKLSTVQEKDGSESEGEPDNVGSPLNKMTFSRTIVLMRKDVRRAKIHIIHRLSRAITKLREAKGNEAKIARCQQKAERLRKKLMHIKELHEDEISRFALSTTQNVTQLATDIKASSSSQALATVAMHQFVAAQVKDFKSKYPDWEKVVPNFLKKKSKKRKLKLDAQESKNTPSNVAQSNLESNETQFESESDSSESDNESNNSQNEVCEENGSDDSMVSQTIRDFNDEISKSNEKKVSIKNERHKNLEETEVSKSNAKNKDISGKCSKKQIGKTKYPSLSVKNSVEAKVADPFFVTTTNEEYKTSQVPLTSEKSLPSEKTKVFEQNKRGRFFTNLDSKKWERPSSEGKYGKCNRFQDSAPYKKQNSNSFDRYSGSPKTDKLVFGNRKERRKALHQPQVEEEPEKLHPSWEAKKKQSNIIPFQGKKVKFD